MNSLELISSLTIGVAPKAKKRRTEEPAPAADDDEVEGEDGDDAPDAEDDEVPAGDDEDDEDADETAKTGAPAAAAKKDVGHAVPVEDDLEEVDGAEEDDE